MTLELVSNNLAYVIDNGQVNTIMKTPTNTVTCSCKEYLSTGMCKHLEFLKENGIVAKPKRLGKDPFYFLKRIENQIDAKKKERFIK